MTPAERGEVLGALIAGRPELEGEAERIAGEFLSSVSIKHVEAALAGIRLDALASHAGIITVNRSCLTCRHYQPPGTRTRDRCLLLDTTLRDQDLRVDCPERQPVAS